MKKWQRLIALFGLLCVYSWCQPLLAFSEDTGLGLSANTKPTSNVTPILQEPPYKTSLPLSEQNWKLLDFTSIPLNDLIRFSEMEQSKSSSLIETLQRDSKASEAAIQLLQQSLKNSQDVLSNLQLTMNQFGERLQSANEESLIMEQFMVALESDLQKLKKNRWVGFMIGSVSFGVGTPLLVEGIRTDNQMMAWSGVGTLGVGGAVWAVGHFVFEVW